MLTYAVSVVSLTASVNSVVNSVNSVNGLRTPRNNASANALVNVDSRTHCVHKLAYYKHDMATHITLFCLQV